MSFQPLVSRWYLAIAEHDRGRLLGRVVVGGDRVVHEGHLHHAVVGRRARRHASRRPTPARGMIGGGVPGCGAACCFGLAGRPRARRPTAARPGTATKWTRSAPRRRRVARSCSSSQPPAHTGSEARSPLPVSGAWSPWTASAHPRAPAPAAPAHAHLEAPARGVGAAHAEQVEAPRRAQHPARGALEVPGRTAMPKPRARAGAPRPRALNGRTSSDPRPAAAPRTRARRRVIVVPPTGARVARRAEGATPARSPATCLGLAAAPRVAVAYALSAALLAYTATAAGSRPSAGSVAHSAPSQRSP